MRHLHGETVDNHVALAPLVALHRIDGDGIQCRDAVGGNMLAHHGNLVAIGDDDAQRGLGMEGAAVQLVEPIDGVGHPGDDIGLVLVHLGRIAVGRTTDGQEYHTPVGEQLLHRVGLVGLRKGERFTLMWKWHRT